MRKGYRLQGMVGYSGDELFGVAQGGADVSLGDAVLVDNLGGGHAAGEAAEDPFHRDAGAANDGFAVLNGGIDDDAVGHIYTLRLERGTDKGGLG